jgi:hypothetical protein
MAFERGSPWMVSLSIVISWDICVPLVVIDIEGRDLIYLCWLAARAEIDVYVQLLSMTRRAVQYHPTQAWKPNLSQYYETKGLERIRERTFL